MKNVFMKPVLLASFSALALTATAQTDSEQSPSAMANPNRLNAQLHEEADLKQRFESMDTDRDTFISRTEGEVDEDLTGRWQEYDLNADDLVDQDEYSAGAMANPNRLNAQLHEEADLKQRFESMDTDRDSFISRTEAEVDEELTKRWQDYDQNTDDMMDQDEFSRFEEDGLTGFQSRSNPEAAKP